MCLASFDLRAEEITESRFASLLQTCRARQPAGPEADISLSKTAVAIRDVAVRQHQLFEGNQVDHSGRMVVFGHAETESDQEAENISQVKAKSIPWRRVLWHWERIGGGNVLTHAHFALEVLYYPKALSDSVPETLQRSKKPLKSLLGDVLSNVDFSKSDDPEATKAAVVQSLIRASLSDVAWSGAFISDVLKQANAQNFKFTSRHKEYIKDAILQSTNDTGDRTTANYYRACDPEQTRPRVGDLYCYHRHVPKTFQPYTKQGQSLFKSLFRDFVKFAQPPIWRAHCDIVVKVDHERSKVVVIGGNVQNSVTEKTLNLAGRSGVLSTSQGNNACATYNPDIRDRSEPNCNLNKQEWFVLLQARN